MPQQLNLNDFVRLLEEATQKGSVKWMLEEGEVDSFTAAFDSGTVRISRIIVGSTYLLDLMDPHGHTIASVEGSWQAAESAEARATYALLERLHRCAKDQAFGGEDKMGALLAEIRRRASEESGVGK